MEKYLLLLVALIFLHIYIKEIKKSDTLLPDSSVVANFSDFIKSLMILVFY